MLPLKVDPAQTAMPQNKAHPRHGSGLPTMQRFATHLVPFARKSLSRPGQRTYRIGSGRMLSRSVVVSIMRAAMPKSPRMAPHHEAQRLKRVLARPTRCWASARQKELILPVARRVSRQRHEICKLDKPTVHNSILDRVASWRCSCAPLGVSPAVLRGGVLLHIKSYFTGSDTPCRFWIFSCP